MTETQFKKVINTDSISQHLNEDFNRILERDSCPWEWFDDIEFNMFDDKQMCDEMNKEATLIVECYTELFE